MPTIHICNPPPSLRGLRISTILPIPPFEKEGFVVSLSAYLAEGENVAIGGGISVS